VIHSKIKDFQDLKNLVFEGLIIIRVKFIEHYSKYYSPPIVIDSKWKNINLELNFYYNPKIKNRENNRE